MSTAETQFKVVERPEHRAGRVHAYDDMFQAILPTLEDGTAVVLPIEPDTKKATPAEYAAYSSLRNRAQKAGLYLRTAMVDGERRCWLEKKETT